MIVDDGGIYEMESEISNPSEQNYRMDFIPSSQVMSIKDSIKQGKIKVEDGDDEDDGEEKKISGGNYAISGNSNGATYQYSSNYSNGKGETVSPSFSNGSGHT